MWICLNDGFVSIVADRNDKKQLLVRARRIEHLLALFPDRKSDIFSAPFSDYQYRLFASRDEVKMAVSTRLDVIDYDNFKNSVMNTDLIHIYHKIWDVIAKRFGTNYNNPVAQDLYR